MFVLNAQSGNRVCFKFWGRLAPAFGSCYRCRYLVAIAWAVSTTAMLETVGHLVFEATNCGRGSFGP